MKNKKSISTIILLTASLWCCKMQAQDSTNISGGTSLGSGGSVSYSVGQIVYTTNSGSSGSAAQGVQQAFEISMLDIKNTTFNVTLNVFPNPTADNLTLQISNFNNEKLSYQLYDMQGKQLDNRQITTQETLVNTSTLPSSIYFIYVIDQDNKKVQSFKIIKN
ncbi:MAG: T9SS type A sorting domain-containing protein [Flavobacterium sp.]